MFKQRFLPIVFTVLSSIGLLFVTARPAEAWGRWGGYWGGPYYGYYGAGWGWGYPYAGYASYSPYRWSYWGSPYATYYPSYYYPSNYSSVPAYTYGAAPAYTYAYGSPGTGSAQSFYYSPSATDTRAHLTVEVPSSSAQVWLEGRPMTQDGTVRAFISPPLESGHDYTYTVRARWLHNGSANDQTQTVRVRPGQDVVVRFGG
jgi:uncharacterized protein (TIGR03000 family)